ncbi:histidinol-phosphatase [Chondrinema litorale]|uniref:histidinol-phosphatase n=1 Tax=Chondrinema litorale TaxID=2994555 RepID=UPI0025428EC6|nr:histidinol-phosphatase [Chondrinema litorale]UZR93558.1 histidinol-phosphatase [Chondrinema litorale]
MAWTNYHGHCYYCDGKLEPEAYVEKALELDMPAIGFSSHCPFEGGHGWNMKMEELPDYLKEVEGLKQQYGDQIQIYTGLEMDYIPGVISNQSEHIKQANLDYTIGSIHYTGVFDDGRFCEIDGAHQKFLEGLHHIFDGDVKAMVSKYFELTREMLKDGIDVLGHLDKIKIQAEQGVLFSEFEDWYRIEVSKTLESIAEEKVILEVNTRGIYKKKSVETYPSKWILTLAKELDIDIMLNADAHHPEELNAVFTETASKLKKIGFKELKVLKNGEWVSLSFSERGVNWE